MELARRNGECPVHRQSGNGTGHRIIRKIGTAFPTCPEGGFAISPDMDGKTQSVEALRSECATIDPDRARLRRFGSGTLCDCRSGFTPRPRGIDRENRGVKPLLQLGILKLYHHRSVPVFDSRSERFNFAGMNYRVTLFQSDEGWAVSCPDLPGCHSQGATREEALENIREAIVPDLANRWEAGRFGSQ